MQQAKDIKKLVLAAGQNDPGAVRQLYNLYARQMLTLSYRITGNLKESEDILQEGFVTAFEKLGQLKQPEAFPFWLKRIIRNKSLKFAEKQMYFEEVPDLPEEEEVEDSYTHLSFDTIRNAIQNLPEGCRQVLTLYLFEEYKHREIADMLNISISTSKSQYRYGLKLLRERLG